jgi:hypothetical protein
MRNTRRRGTRLLLYMYDFISLANFYQAALVLRTRVDVLLTRLGTLRNPMKGVRSPTQVGGHLGLALD